MTRPSWRAAAGRTIGGFIRSTGVLTGIAVSLTTVIAIPLEVIREGWKLWHWVMTPVQDQPDALQQILITLDRFVSQLALHLYAEPISLYAFLSVPPAPAFSWVVGSTISALILVMAGLAFMHHLVPMRLRLNSAARADVIRIDEEHHYQTYLNSLTGHSRFSRIDLYVMTNASINAFAMSSPLGSHAVVVTQGLLNQLPEPAIRWVIAHEVGHIYHGDTRRLSLWLLAMRGIVVFVKLRVVLMNAFLRLIHALPLIGIVCRPLLILFKVLALVGRLGHRAGLVIFHVFDRWTARGQEYRADVFAAEREGAGTGIALFRVMIRDWKPQFTIFSTHPTHSQRINHLLQWQSHRTHNQKSSQGPLS